jgi:hypothetical protein
MTGNPLATGGFGVILTIRVAVTTLSIQYRKSPSVERPSEKQQDE